MSRSVTALVIASALVASPGFAQFGGGGMGGMVGQNEPSWPTQKWSVKVETGGGKTLTGTLELKDVAVECDFGVYHIRPENVKSIRFIPLPEGTPLIIGPGGARTRGAVTTAPGEEIEGAVLVRSWTVETELGQVVLNPSGLRSVTFSGRVGRRDETTGARKDDAPVEKK